MHSISADYYTGITSDRKSLGEVTVNGDYTILAKQNDVDAYLVFDDKNLTIEYLYHDEIINPRGLNSSISLLIKEFHKGNPQLHISLARLNNGKIQIFDGQHKAVAQIMLGVRELIPTLEPIDWKTK